LTKADYYPTSDFEHDNVFLQQHISFFGFAIDLVIRKSTDKNLVERVTRYKNQK